MRASGLFQRVVASAFAAFFVAALARAENCTWVGGDGDWDVAENWTKSSDGSHAVPTAAAGAAESAENDGKGGFGGGGKVGVAGVDGTGGGGGARAAGGSGIVIVRLLRLKPKGFLLFVK